MQNQAGYMGPHHYMVSCVCVWGGGGGYAQVLGQWGSVGVWHCDIERWARLVPDVRSYAVLDEVNTCWVTTRKNLCGWRRELL